ncbi:MAG: dependent epimerase/dehydratase family protein [Gemmatimonadetes bacterium]|nr:dependent epimerase/dehydratase family protein [Gemmatimonadota bacterium]
MTADTHPPRDEAELEERLSRPSPSLGSALANIAGDLVILGAGGKMGPTLARMAKRANPERRVVAVSRWSDRSAAESLESYGVETVRVDLLDAESRAALPDAPNVVFMAGQKFGTMGSPATTWAMNAGVPAHVAERYAGARTVVFSTGNVYALTTPESGGSREHDVPAPIGEYAFSCLARERLFTDASARLGTPVAIVRLNYAHDLRYGVLTDLAVRIANGESIDLRMSCVNVIWQGDANALALAALAHATSPEPYIVNVAGRDVPCVEDLAKALATRLGKTPIFTGEAAADSLLSNSSRMHELSREPLLPLDTLLDWVADWVKNGGRLLGKPTNFERRDGQF